MKNTYERLRWACSNRGAEMGRRNNIPEDMNTLGKLHLIKLPWVDGDYDPKGAYWGCGGRGQNIYWAYGETATAQVDIFVRSTCRKYAKIEIDLAISVAIGKEFTAKFYR